MADFFSLLARRRVHVRLLTANQTSVFARVDFHAVAHKEAAVDVLAQRKKKVALHLVGDIRMTPSEWTESCLFSSYFTPNPRWNPWSPVGGILYLR